MNAVTLLISPPFCLVMFTISLHVFASVIVYRVQKAPCSERLAAPMSRDMEARHESQSGIAQQAGPVRRSLQLACCMVVRPPVFIGISISFDI